MIEDDETIVAELVERAVRWAAIGVVLLLGASVALVAIMRAL